jgi:hypothetical protein
VLLRLFEKDSVQQPSFVVVEFDNHEILATNEQSCFQTQKTKLWTSTLLRRPCFYTAREASRFSSEGASQMQPLTLVNAPLM